MKYCRKWQSINLSIVDITRSASRGENSFAPSQFLSESSHHQPGTSIVFLIVKFPCNKSIKQSKRFCFRLQQLTFSSNCTVALCQRSSFTLFMHPKCPSYLLALPVLFQMLLFCYFAIHNSIQTHSLPLLVQALLGFSGTRVSENEMKNYGKEKRSYFEFYVNIWN